MHDDKKVIALNLIASLAVHQSYIKNNPCFRSVFECILDLPKRNTKPWFTNVYLYKDIVLGKIKDGTLWRVVHENEACYTKQELIKDILQFCFDNKIGLKERRHLLELVKAMVYDGTQLTK